MVVGLQYLLFPESFTIDALVSALLSTCSTVILVVLLVDVFILESVSITIIWIKIIILSSTSIECGHDHYLQYRDYVVVKLTSVLPPVPLKSIVPISEPTPVTN